MNNQIPEELMPAVNEIARELYAIRGYTVREDYDFFTATHPQKKEALRGAMRSLQILNDYCLDGWGSSLNDLIENEESENKRIRRKQATILTNQDKIKTKIEEYSQSHYDYEVRNLQAALQNAAQPIESLTYLEISNINWAYEIMEF